MVTRNWATSQVALTDRAEALRQTIRREVVPVELDLPRRPESVFADVVISGVGPLQVSTVRANPARVHRTPRLTTADEEPFLFVSLQVSGDSTVVQDGRAAVLSPGDIAFYDTRRPYTLLFDRGVNMHFFRVPLGDLALPDSLVSRSAARTLGADGTVSGLTASYLARLAADPRLRDGSAAQLLAVPTLELLRAAVTAGAETCTAEGLSYESLGARITAYIRAHLAEDDLTPATVARAHHISVRHLYAVLAREGIGFGDWVRAERLDACRRELSRLPAVQEPIAALARRWGFRSPSHFSRAFKAAYGVSPRAWRQGRRASWNR
ncbi:helix-turn-helix domain-containing protein [Streptomyces sp. NPDC091271]|uniref:AraC-like ligand-binding domain-containing protein n=1 Tax=Streptomyces sp. NPDC091271 TaxID=3365980 RepID=UPI00381DA4EE